MRRGSFTFEVKKGFFHIENNDKIYAYCRVLLTMYISG